MVRQRPPEKNGVRDNPEGWNRWCGENLSSHHHHSMTTWKWRRKYTIRWLWILKWNIVVQHIDKIKYMTHCLWFNWFKYCGPTTLQWTWIFCHNVFQQFNMVIKILRWKISRVSGCESYPFLLRIIFLPTELYSCERLRDFFLTILKILT
jgi:hypothetical protein